MLNSLISRGPAGGDLPREGWESLESRPPPFARPTLPSSLQPPSFVILSSRAIREQWNLLETRSKCLRSRGSLRFLVSPSTVSTRRVDTWIYSPPTSRIQNSRHRVAQKEGGGRGRRRWSKHSPFSSRGLEYSAVLLSDETDSKKI